jgi:hypothetical protein
MIAFACEALLICLWARASLAHTDYWPLTTDYYSLLLCIFAVKNAYEE